MAETCSYCASDAVERCSLCERPLCTEHTHPALPYLSLGEFLGTIFRTLLTAPGNLPTILTEPGKEAPFCVEHHMENSARRVREQRKFFYLVLGLVVLCGVIGYLLVRFL